jgi:uncharacterized membrane protein YoaK (UPF0700 family)
LKSSRNRACRDLHVSKVGPRTGRAVEQERAQALAFEFAMASSSILASPAPPIQGIGIPVRRVLSLALVAGYVDALGFIDLNGIYTAAMTGNTVQLGIALVREQWPHFAVVAATLGAFFCGGLFSSFTRRRLPHPALELLIMVPLVLAAQAVRLYVPNPIAIELPLLAVVMAMQGETISRVGGMPIQTIVVTNNLLKFADGIVGRYLSYGKRPQATGGNTGRSTQADVVLPGCAWLAYTVGAGSAAVASVYLSLPFIAPAALLVLTTVDLLVTRPFEDT